MGPDGQRFLPQVSSVAVGSVIARWRMRAAEDDAHWPTRFVDAKVHTQAFDETGGVQFWLNVPCEIQGMPRESTDWTKLQCTAEHLQARS